MNSNSAACAAIRASVTVLFLCLLAGPAVQATPARRQRRAHPYRQPETVVHRRLHHSPDGPRQAGPQPGGQGAEQSHHRSRPALGEQLPALQPGALRPQGRPVQDVVHLLHRIQGHQGCGRRLPDPMEPRRRRLRQGAGSGSLPLFQRSQRLHPARHFVSPLPKTGSTGRNPTWAWWSSRARGTTTSCLREPAFPTSWTPMRRILPAATSPRPTTTSTTVTISGGSISTTRPDGIEWTTSPENQEMDISDKQGRWGPNSFMGWDPIKGVYVTHIESCPAPALPPGKKDHGPLRESGLRPLVGSGDHHDPR